MKLSRQQIIKVFTELERLKKEGIWFSGIKGKGEYKEWHYNGQLAIDANYKNGELNGQYKQWSEDGQLEIDAEYKNDEEDGQYKQWHDNGQLKIDAKYNDGKIIYRYEYNENGNEI